MINVGKRGANQMIKANNERGDVWVGGEDTEFLTAGMVVVYFLMKGYETP